MDLRYCDDCPPIFVFLLAYCVVAAGIGFVLARRRPGTLWVTIPLILVGHVLLFGEWWFTIMDQAARLLSILVPPVGALSRRWYPAKSHDPSPRVP